MIAAEAPAIEAAMGVGSLRARCVLCDAPATFDAACTPGSLREGLACAVCRCNARQRAAAEVLLSALDRPDRAAVYISEQASPLFVALRRRIGGLVGSEFNPGPLRRVRFSAWLARRGVLQGIRHEDMTAMRFPDACMDAVLSLDVLEHVPHYRLALREWARVVRPGGVAVFTVPFYDDQAASEAVAWLRPDGSIGHAGEPEYHGDPRGPGVLCFHHFGWTLLDDLRDAGFADARALRIHGLERGLPEGQWVILARR